MKITKVSLTKAFPTGPYLNDKVGIEIDLEEFDGPDDCLDKAKSTIEQWHKEAHPHLYQSIDNGPNIQTAPNAPTSIPTPAYEINVAHERLEIEIDNCKTKEELKDWKKIHITVPGKVLSHYNTRMEILRIEENNKQMGETNSIK